METAKIDLRKLQLLNDRINQCLDALNQVRLSVHGLSHSSAPGVGQQPIGLGMQNPQQLQQLQQLQSQFQPQFQGVFPNVPGTFAGLSHSNAGIGVNPLAQGQQPWANPFALAAHGQVPFGTPFGAYGAPIGQPFVGGLSHTNPIGVGSDWTAGATSNDPYFLMKVVQTFPYVQQQTPPAISFF